MKQEITLKAHGKINLGLDVLRRLENGYHELRMIMQSVKLADEVGLRRLETDEIRIKTNSGKIPCDEHNLAYKAARLMRENYKITEGVEITIEKKIPVAAGMAGGSADCAAVLKGMNGLFELGLTEEELKKEGVKLGADVPFCIMEGTALSEGIGEVLTKIKTPPECILLLAKPDVDVSTAYVYQNLHLEHLKRHPDIDGIMKAIQEGSLEELCGKLENVLETVTGAKYPVIGEIEGLMKAEGALQAIMSGSGPTVFGIFREKEKAERAGRRIKEKYPAGEVFLSGFWGREA